MCVQTYLHFSKCDHVSTTLTTCPTFHREQASSKGFLGGLFRRSSSSNKNNKTNCGKVVPHHLTNETYCQACSIKKGHLRAHGVGQGALRVRRQETDESFREERKRAAKASLEKSEKRQHLDRGGKQQKSNHEVLHVESSVWLHDLYHHPETLARKEAYARQAAAAPPVSSRPPKSNSTSNHSGSSSTTTTRTMGSSSSHRTQETDSRRKESSRSRRIEEGGHDRTRTRRAPRDSPQWTPSYGSSQPMRRPVQPTPTYQSQYSGRFANDHNARGLPPAVGLLPLPPLPPNAHPKPNSYRQQSTSTTHPHQPPSKPEPKYPELRHKTGRVYNSNKSRNPPTKPAYQEYLDAMDTQAAMDRLREVKERKAREQQAQRYSPLLPPPPARMTTMMRDDPKPHHQHQHQHHSGWIINRAKKVGWSDADSDDSFACRDARAISDSNHTHNRDPRSAGSSSPRRRSRK